MMKSLKKEVLKKVKKIQIKYPKGEKLFFGRDDGYLLEFSMIGKKTVHEQKILDNGIRSMAKTPDTKS